MSVAEATIPEVSPFKGGVGRRVLFLDHVARMGGAEHSLLDIVRHYPESEVVLFEDGPFKDKLMEQGTRTQVLSASGSVMKVDTGSSLVRSLRSVPGLFSLVGKLARLAKGHEAMYANSQKSFVVAALAQRRAGIPLIWHLRDILTAGHFGSLQRRVGVQLANRRASMVIVNSEATGRAFVECGGREDLVRVVHNGIDASDYVPDAEGAARLRKELAPEGAFLVGSFSRISQWKGQHVLVEALSGIPNGHGLLVGDPLFGPDHAYMQDLKALVEKKKMTDRIHFLGYRDDVPQLMQAVDIVAHTSTEPEPFGRVLVEGMLSKTAVIATRAGGAVEIITDGHDGLLTECGDAASLEAAVRRLMDQPELGSRLAESGYQTAMERFTTDTMLESLGKLIAESCDHNASGSP